MNVDNDNFYDELSSFMPTPGDYNLDDLDEIIRSTDSHLDASLDLNIFSKSLEQNDYDMVESSASYQQEQQRQGENMTATLQTNEFNFSFSAFPSPATSHQSSSSMGDFNSPYETPARTSSTSSVDGDIFNPDDFINFFNNDDIKVEECDLTQDTIRQLNHHNERNTPSPTGSCTSSSGSSTSGVQSDISSTASMSQNTTSYTQGGSEADHEELSEFIKFKDEKSDKDVTMQELEGTHHTTHNEGVFRMPLTPSDHIDNASNNVSVNTSTSLNLPMMPLANFQPIQTVNVVQGTIIPVAQTAALTTPTPVISVIPSAHIKVENKSEVVPKTLAAQSPIKGVPNKSGTSPAKIAAPPTNTKPKTIFLSSNDFKALMQKMNTTNAGAAGGCSKKTSYPNGQMPKIIMKTASGKYITGNKMPAGSVIPTNKGNSEIASSTRPNNSEQQQSKQMVTKLFKTSMAKNHQQQNHSNVGNAIGRSGAGLTSAARASLQHSKGCRTDFSMLKGLSEDKLIKKQLRMLKNRESASLSRKKKKEYVERLENRISNLERENYSLRGENSSLRSQLMAFAKTCDCKHRNVSEFILNTLSMNEHRHGHGATVLDDIDASFLIDEDDSSDHSDRTDDFSSSPKSSLPSRTTTTQHVRIAPKPLNASASSINRNFRHRMNSSTVKKNVAVLFAMAFMVTLNVGNFQSYLNKSALENALEATAGASNTPNEGVDSADIAASAGTGRRLLWVPNEHEFNEQNNRSKREADFHSMPPPPLHFLRPVNRSTADELNGTTTKDEPPIKNVKNRPMNFGNGTNYAQENNMRLARNLHKWIGGNDYLNLTGSTVGFDGRRVAQFKFGKSAEYDDYDLGSPQDAVGVKQKRKIIFDAEAADVVAGKHKKYDIGTAAGDVHNSLGIYKPRISEEYLKLFKGIKRQDDTFYVLSFNLDHILLPASVSNKSARPKMSLLLPAGNPSMNGDVVLMQIDCDVVNTTEIEVKSHMIPEKLRPIKYGPNNVRVHRNDMVNNETKSAEARANVKAKNNGGGGEIHLKREEDSKDKPAAPRTYFMMTPKNQSSGASSGETVIKKRPTIVKLNANDSVIGSGIMNVRNSTLFTRMKDTVVNGGGGGAANGFVATATQDVRKVM